MTFSRAGRVAGWLATFVLSGSGAIASDEDAPAGAQESAGEDKAVVAHPVVTVSPAQHSFKRLVRGWGTVLADARSARSVSSATEIEVRAIEVLPGEHVKAGAALLTVAADPLAVLAAQQAVTALKVADADVERLTVARADNLATQSQLDVAIKARADAVAAFEAARRQGASSEATVLRSPIDGVVTAVAVQVGDRPASGTALVTVAPSVVPRVTLGIEPTDQSLVHVGNRVTLRAVETRSKERTGRVAIVGGALNKDTRLIDVVVALDPGESGEWLPGLAVQGSIEIAAVSAFAVPRSALVRDEQGAAVFEVVDAHAHRVPVTIEVEEGGQVGVTGALDPKRPVVTTGAYEMEDGALIAEPKR